MKVRIEIGTTYVPLERPNKRVEFFWARTILPEYSGAGDLTWSERRAFNLAVFDWVEATYGEQLDWSRHERQWMATNNTYYFKQEKDRTMFILRWS